MKWLVVLLMLGAASAAAHELIHEVAREPALVVTLREDDGDAFAHQHYDIFAPGEDTPYASGRSDALGRVVFLPDRPGDWRVLASSEDGHGVALTVNLDAAGTALARPHSLWERAARPLVGAALILGMFGLLALFGRKRS